MILGAHVSVAGGLHNGPRNGKSLGCESIQINANGKSSHWKQMKLRVSGMKWMCLISKLQPLTHRT